MGSAYLVALLLPRYILMVFVSCIIDDLGCLRCRTHLISLDLFVTGEIPLHSAVYSAAKLCGRGFGGLWLVLAQLQLKGFGREAHSS